MTELAIQSATSGAGASAQAIQFHYDVGTEFYRLWLDRECLYSCALWSESTPTLEQAQQAKLDYMLAQSGVQSGERLLDIGCGWGGLLRRARTEFAVAHAQGLTLAETQAAYIEHVGTPGVDVRVQNWRDHTPSAPYHAIVSIGAFEHFAHPALDEAGKIAVYRVFFEKCSEWLESERTLALQTITYERASARDVNPFLRDHIFPESELPHVDEVVRASKGLFELVALRGDRQHYARTLEVWSARLRNRRDEAVALVGEQTVERYERYLKLSRLGFLSGNLGLARFTFRKLRKY